MIRCGPFLGGSSLPPWCCSAPARAVRRCKLRVRFRPRPSGPSGAAGKGFYVTQRRDGVLVGGNRRPAKKTKPKVTQDFQGPPGTNDWWSSLIWQYENEEPYSYEMFPHPLTLRASGDGLAIGYSDKPTITPREYMFPYEKRSRRRHRRASARRDTRVASYSDWSVTAEWPG